MQMSAPSVGMMQVCGTSAVQVLNSTDIYRSQASLFTFSSAWSATVDGAASNGRCATVRAGAPPPSGAYGAAFVPAPRTYDIWYRLRVANPASGSPQMLLTLTDVTANTYAAAIVLSANQATTSYSWIRAAANLAPTSGHSVRFQVNVAGRLTTDWYIDAAVLLPAGSSAPVS
jgi:hypothetical protein